MNEFKGKKVLINANVLTRALAVLNGPSHGQPWSTEEQKTIEEFRGALSVAPFRVMDEPYGWPATLEALERAANEIYTEMSSTANEACQRLALAKGLRAAALGGIVGQQEGTQMAPYDEPEFQGLYERLVGGIKDICAGIVEGRREVVFSSKHGVEGAILDELCERITDLYQSIDAAEAKPPRYPKIRSVTTQGEEITSILVALNASYQTTFYAAGHSYAQPIFRWGKDETASRHAAGVFLSHVLPRIRDQKWCGSDVIDQLLDGIQTSSYSANESAAVDLAKMIGDDPDSFDIPENCDVRKILLSVQPGEGDGQEVYAKNVEDVERVLSDLGERVEAMAGHLTSMAVGLDVKRTSYTSMTAALVRLKDACGADAAKAVIREIGGVGRLADIPKERHAAVEAVALIATAHPILIGFLFERDPRKPKLKKPITHVAKVDYEDSEGDEFDEDAAVKAVHIFFPGAGGTARFVPEHKAEPVRTTPGDALTNQFIGNVIRFNLGAGRTMDEFNPREIALGTCFQLEELSEKLRAIASGMPKGGVHPIEGMALVSAIHEMEYLGSLFKGGTFDGAFEHSDLVELLDGDIDVAWVSFGSMMSQGVDIFGALDAVAKANLGKLVDGKAIFDERKKIMKPEGWKKADLVPFLNKRFRPI